MIGPTPSWVRDSKINWSDGSRRGTETRILKENFNIFCVIVPIEYEEYEKVTILIFLKFKDTVIRKP